MFWLVSNAKGKYERLWTSLWKTFSAATESDKILSVRRLLEEYKKTEPLMLASFLGRPFTHIQLCPRVYSVWYLRELFVYNLVWMYAYLDSWWMRPVTDPGVISLGIVARSRDRSGYTTTVGMHWAFSIIVCHMNVTKSWKAGLIVPFIFLLEKQLIISSLVFNSTNMSSM